MATTSQPPAGGPPPKPWEREGSTSGPTPFRPPSGGSTSDVVEASGTAKPGEIVSTSNRTTPVNTNAVGRALPTRPWESNYGTSSYGGYNSGLNYGSGYGSGMYNSSYGGGYGGGMYGGGMYGGSMFNRGGLGGGLYGSGMYGGGMYNSGMGGPMGGYGMGMGGPQDPNNPPPSPPGFWISFLRVLFDRGGVLYGELARFVLRILGWRRKSRKVGPPGPNGLPLPAPNSPMKQALLEGPKAAPTGGAWDNVWGTDASK